ncbi:hypothetical protein [Anaplasma marginale]|nr:hypothetical protein [Anaplasma marginale]
MSMSSEYAQWYIGQSLGRQTWVLSYSRGNIPKKYICRLAQLFL